MSTVANMSAAKSSSNKMRPQFVRGFPTPPIFKKEVIEEIFDFMPSDGDVILATYPKTGTTWMSYIIVQILTKGDSFPPFNHMVTEVVPYLELTGVSVLESMKTRPRVYRHHFPYNMVKRNPKSKIIYVYRKPEDTLVSYYHFLSGIYEQLDMEEFLDYFLSGEIGYGGYFENILSYLEHKNEENLLLVSFENLLLNNREGILRIAEFLGREYYINLMNDESALNKVLAQTSFDYMKQNLSEESSEEKAPTEGPTIRSFFRKGKIGDGKQTLTENQLQRLRLAAEEAMKGSDVLKEWYDEKSHIE